MVNGGIDMVMDPIFDASGAMVKNRWIGNYYLLGDGTMAKNQWIGSYYVGSDGCWR